MASLTGQPINTTYPSLLKTSGNIALDPTTKTTITDGEGNTSPISMSQVAIDFSGDIDFTSATVTGLPAGAVGLESGTGSGSMKSAAALTPIGANASGTYTVALGNNARATADESVGIGHYSNATGAYSIAMGGGAFATAIHSMAFKGGASASGALAIGWDAGASGQNSIAFGKLSNGNGTGSVGIGDAAKARADYSICIGANALVDDAVRINTVVIGRDAKAAQYSTALGAGAFAVGDLCISIGDANTYDTGAIAIGDQAASFTKGAVALGRNITAIAWQDSTTVNQIAFVNYAALDYLNNAAAAAGGVPLGGVYHTDGNLKIRHT